MLLANGTQSLTHIKWFDKSPNSWPLSKRPLRKTYFGGLRSTSIFKSTCVLGAPFIAPPPLLWKPSLSDNCTKKWSLTCEICFPQTKNILWVTFLFRLFFCLQEVKKQWKLRMRLFSAPELFEKYLFCTWTGKTFLNWCILTRVTGQELPSSLLGKKIKI